MFIDASALTAMLTNKDAARELLARLQQNTTRVTSRLPSPACSICRSPRRPNRSQAISR